jgi:hypothetical protein
MVRASLIALTLVTTAGLAHAQDACPNRGQLDIVTRTMILSLTRRRIHRN